MRPKLLRRAETALDEVARAGESVSNLAETTAVQIDELRPLVQLGALALVAVALLSLAALGVATVALMEVRRA